jgi:hypothetical protein
MDMTELEPKVIQVDVEKLQFDLQNPRFADLKDQRDALHAFCADRHARKTVLLAENIADVGLNPSELMIVIYGDRRGHYVVLEGNRRLAAMKLLSVPARLGDSPLSKPFQARLRTAAKEANGAGRKKVQCILMPSREEANDWIALKHTGENEGIGVVSWDGEETARFRGSDPGYKLLDFVRSKARLSEAALEGMKRFPVTNLDRLLGDPDFRRGLGIEIEQGVLLMTHPASEVLVALTKIVEDLAKREITVNSIKLKSDRTEYLNQIRDHLPTSGPLPNPVDLTGVEQAQGGNETERAGAESSPVRRRNVPPTLERKTLVPKTCVIPISLPKVNDVFKELRHLNVDSFPIAAASLLRTIIDTTTLEYVEKFGIDVRRNHAGQMELKPRIEAAITHFSTQAGNREAGTVARNQLLQTSGAIYVDALHLTLHSRLAHPISDNLRLGWNMIEPFIKGMWAALEALANRS